MLLGQRVLLIHMFTVTGIVCMITACIPVINTTLLCNYRLKYTSGIRIRITLFRNKHSA